MNLQWLKNRWKELRWGSGIYLASFITFSNFILLLRLNFGLSNLQAILAFVGLSTLALVVGNLHGRVQQSTDALMENKAVIDEIVRQVVQALRKE